MTRTSVGCALYDSINLSLSWGTALFLSFLHAVTKRLIFVNTLKYYYP